MPGRILCIAGTAVFIEPVGYANTFFLILFTVELLLKLAAYGHHGYWADTWNRMDMFVIFASWSGRVTSGVSSDPLWVPVYSV